MVKHNDEEMEDLQHRTNQLSTEIDGDDDEEEETTAPPQLLRKINALKHLHENVLAIDVEYKKERIALEQKYRELRKPIYNNQSQIISGEVDVPADSDSPDATSKDVEEDEVKGIPGYWAQALLSHPSISEIVTEEDVPALEALTNVIVEYNDDYSSFKLTFFFEENEFFSNETISKTYTVAPDLLDEKSPTLVEHQTSEVQWKEGKNLCVAEVKKKQKSKAGKSKGQVRTITTLEPKQSFFQYFCEPMDDEEEEEDEDEDEEKPRIKLTVEEDYDIGHAIRTAIIPESVLWFTGEAIDDEEYGDDEDNDDEEEGDDDDDEGVVATPGNGFAAPAGAPGGAEQPECKQN